MRKKKRIEVIGAKIEEQMIPEHQEGMELAITEQPKPSVGCMALTTIDIQLLSISLCLTEAYIHNDQPKLMMLRKAYDVMPIGVQMEFDKLHSNFHDEVDKINTGKIVVDKEDIRRQVNEQLKGMFGEGFAL